MIYVVKLFSRVVEGIRSKYLHSPFDYLALFSHKYALRKPVTRIGKLSREWLIGNLPVDANIIEIGSFNGLDAIKLSRLFPKGSITSFEPVPKLFSSAFARTSGFKNIKMYPVAFGNCCGLIEMFVSGGTSNASSSIFSPENINKFYHNIKFAPEEKTFTPIVTLKCWSSTTNMGPIDLLWIDAQGAEYEILSNSKLEDIRFIYTEVNFEEVYKGITTFEKLNNYLIAHNFKLIELWRSGPQGDALYGR